MVRYQNNFHNKSPIVCGGGFYGVMKCNVVTFANMRINIDKASKYRVK